MIPQTAALACGEVQINRAEVKCHIRDNLSLLIISNGELFPRSTCLDHEVRRHGPYAVEGQAE